MVAVSIGHAATEVELQKAVRGEKLSEDEFASVKKALEEEARSGFKSIGAMQQLIAKLKDAPAVEIGPDKEDQFRVLSHPLVAFRMVVEAELAGSVLTPDQLQKHPSADKFPGEIHRAIKPGIESCEINVNGYRWQSTGLYAPPGEIVHVRIPEEYIDAGWKVRIGANNTTIDIPRHTKLKRFPKIDREYDLTERTTKIASAFGGLLYIDLPVPKNAVFEKRNSDIYNLIDHYDPPPKKMVTVDFANVILAPRYVHGETNVQQWRASIRSYPAPYAEIGSDKVIFTLPSTYIRRLDVPDLVVEKWDAVVDAMSELSGRPKTKPFPHRFLIDAHVNWGLAFASYPINAPLSWAETIVRGEIKWGHVHELGHLHQHRSWTYQGTNEITVNIFSTYALEVVDGQRQSEKSRQQVIEKARKYLSRPEEERNWMKVNGAVGERLGFYTLLAHEFGWEPYKQVFREYRELPLNKHPRSQTDRASQFMIRMSRATNHNLGPYFTQWGVQVNQAALEEVKSLPAWDSPMMKEAMAKGK